MLNIASTRWLSGGRMSFLIEKRSFWFSEKQKKERMQQGLGVIICVLENGRQHEVTEAVNIGKKPIGSWDDYKFVGNEYHTKYIPYDPIYFR